jgi:RHS repeat-associated protein
MLASSAVLYRRCARTVAFFFALAVVLFAPGSARADLDTQAAQGGGSGVFGGTGMGQVDVTSGAATTAIPIITPRARGAAQVDLALGYSSSAGLGDVALGWSLSLPSIERTGIASPRPRFTSPVDAIGHDRYVFGGRPLVHIGDVTSTSCPAPGCIEPMPSWAIGGSYYRLQDEGAFARFFLLSSGRTWRVQFKDGLTWEFGRPLCGGPPSLELDGAVDDLSGMAVRWNLVRKYEVCSGETGLVAYIWRHVLPLSVLAKGDPPGLLTDVYDTPPATSADDLTTYANHSILEYLSYDNNNRAPIWSRQPQLGVIQITVRSPGGIVRTYHLDRERRNNQILLTRVRVQGRGANEQTLVNMAYTDPPAAGPFTFDLGAAAAPGGPPLPTDALQNPNRATFLDVDGDGVSDVLEVLKGSDGTTYTTPYLHLNRRNNIWTAALEYNTAAFLTSGGGGDMTSFLAASIDGSSTPAQWLLGGSITTVSLLPRPGDGSPEFFRVGTVGHGTHNWFFNREPTTAVTPTSPPLIPAIPPVLIGDMDADGLPDAAYAGSKTCFASRLQDHSIGIWDPIATTPSCVPGNGLSIANPMVAGWFQTLVDVNGDGIADYVRGTDDPDTHHHTVQCVAGIGDGTFAHAGDSSDWCVDFSTFLNIPIPNTTKDIPLIGDVTGDGFADFVLVSRTSDTSVHIALYSTSDGGRTYPQIADRYESFDAVPARVALADIDGSGIPSVAFVARGFVRYVDFHYQAPDWADAPRPGLLKAIWNDHGAETDFHYMTLADLEAKQVADPQHPWNSLGRWSRHSPVGQVVVTQVDNKLNLPAPVGEIVTRHFDYRDVVYDPWTGKNIGFERTMITDDGDPSYQPTLITETTYFYGNCPPRDGADTCPGTTDLDPYRPLTGRPVLVEVRDPMWPAPYSTTHYHYTLQTLFNAPAPDNRSVRFAYVSDVNNFLYDTDVSNQGGASSWVAYDVNDQYVRNVPIRNTNGVAHLRKRLTLDDVGNTLTSIDDGRVQDDLSPIDRPIRVDSVPQNFYFTNPGSWIWRTAQTSVSYDAGGDAPLGPDAPVRTTATDFDSLGRPRYQWALLTGSLPLNRRHQNPSEQIAPPPAQASTDGWLLVSHTLYDSYGNATSIEGPNGSCSTSDYSQDPYRLRPGTISQSTSGSGCPGATALVTTITYDPTFGVPTDVVDPTGARSHAQFDDFARVVSMSGPDPNDQTNTRLEVQTDYGVSSQGFQVTHMKRVLGASTETWTYYDGYGRAVLTLHPSDDPGVFIANGLPEKTARGIPFGFARPWTYTGNPADYPIAPPYASYFAFASYDAVGRQYMLFKNNEPYPTSYRINHALSAEVFDEEDFDTTSPHYMTPTHVENDGHGRIRRVDEKFDVWGDTNLDIATTLYTYTATGNVNGIRKTHATGPEVYSRWMRYDSLGRLVENAEPHTTLGHTDDWTATGAMKALRYAYNDSGRVVGTSDARGCGENSFYDVAGRVVAVDYSPCVVGQQHYSPIDLVTGNGSEAFFVYDAPEPGQTIYGSNVNVLKGRLASVRDRGSHTLFGYDGRGNVTATARRIANPGPTQYVLSERYSLHWFTKWNLYDGLDRLTTTTTGAESPELVDAAGNSQSTIDYSPRGLPAHIGSTYGDIVTSAGYETDGKISYRVFGDAASTNQSFAYDASRRLYYEFVQRNPQSVTPWNDPPTGYTPPERGATGQAYPMFDIFTYDRVGNVKLITDGRDADEWPDGAKPVSKLMQYDGLYRLGHVDYFYSTETGEDIQTSPFAAEDAAGDTRPVPRSALPQRVQWQDYRYDWFGDTTATTDDSSATFDRSLGTITNLTAEMRPGQIGSAVQGDGGVAPVYDAAGNLVDLQVGRPGPCTTKCFQRFIYEWDEVGNLSHARRWDYASAADVPVYPSMPVEAPAAELLYTYSGGVRVLKESLPAGPDPTPTFTVEVFDSLRLKGAHFDSAETVRYQQDATTEEVRLLGGARLVYSNDLPTLSGNPVHVFLEITDHLGSTAVVIDRETGELVERSTYQGYGAPDSDYRPARWQSFREDFRYTGKEDDIEVGLTYFGARYYSAQIGRWISPDPVTVHAARGDLNPYGYVHGRTFNTVDPLGLLCIPLINCETGGSSGGSGGGGYSGDGGGEGHGGGPCTGCGGFNRAGENWHGPDDYVRTERTVARPEPTPTPNAMGPVGGNFVFRVPANTGPFSTLDKFAPDDVEPDYWNINTFYGTWNGMIENMPSMVGVVPIPSIAISQAILKACCMMPNSGTAAYSRGQLLAIPIGAAIGGGAGIYGAAEGAMAGAAKGVAADLVVVDSQPSNSLVHQSASALAATRGENLTTFSGLSSAYDGETLSIVGHGNPSSLAGMSSTQLSTVINGSGMSPSSIELLACQTGCGTFAQEVANATGVPVLAPVGNVNILGGIRGVPQVRMGGVLQPPGRGFVWFSPVGAP